MAFYDDESGGMGNFQRALRSSKKSAIVRAAITPKLGLTKGPATAPSRTVSKSTVRVAKAKPPVIRRRITRRSRPTITAPVKINDGEGYSSNRSGKIIKSSIPVIRTARPSKLFLAKKQTYTRKTFTKKKSAAEVRRAKKVQRLIAEKKNSVSPVKPVLVIRQPTDDVDLVMPMAVVPPQVEISPVPFIEPQITIGGVVTPTTINEVLEGTKMGSIASGIARMFELENPPNEQVISGPEGKFSRLSSFEFPELFDITMPNMSAPVPPISYPFSAFDSGVPEVRVGGANPPSGSPSLLAAPGQKIYSNTIPGYAFQGSKAAPDNSLAVTTGDRDSGIVGLAGGISMPMIIIAAAVLTAFLLLR